MNSQIKHKHRNPVSAALALYLLTATRLIGGSVFWEPYQYDSDTVAIFSVAGAAGADSEDLDTLLTEPDAGIDALAPAVEPADQVHNANPVGKPGALAKGAVKDPENGRFGGGIRLPTNDARFSCSSGSSRGTTEFWIKVDALPATPLVVMRRFAPGSKEETLLLLQPDGRLELSAHDQRIDSKEEKVAAGQWTHVAVTLDWQFEFNGLMRLHVNGTTAAEAVPRWDYRVVNALVAQKELQVGGVVGWLDEIRVSKSPRSYYPYELGWEDKSGDRELPAGQPFFRDATDLRLYVPFDDSLKPGVAPETLTVAEESLRVRGLGDRPEQRGFSQGVRRFALTLGPELAQPVYAAPNLLDSNNGTLAFWLRPLDWDNFKRVSHRMESSQVRKLVLFRIFGRKPPAIRKFNPMRGGDPSLMTMTLDITPDSARPVPPALHPGRWTHVAVTWQDGNVLTYIDGHQVSYAGIEAAVHGWWRENGEQLKGDIFAGSEPESLRFDGRHSDLHTSIDELRIYSRPLSAPEVANLAIWHRPTAEAVPLPALDTTMAFNGATGDIAVEATPLIADYKRVRKMVATLDGRDDAAADTAAHAAGLTSLRLSAGALEFGEHQVVVQALDAQGKEIAHKILPATHSRPPWWKTDAGQVTQAMPEWEQVTVADASVRVWGRELQFAPSGLPAQIVSAGKPLLAGPVQLIVGHGGTTILLTPGDAPRLQSVDGLKASVSGVLRGNGLTVQSHAVVDFDGMAWFSLTLAPAVGSEQVHLDQCEIRIPYRAENAELCHWSSAQRDFRDPAINWIGEVPAGEGVVLRSNDFERWQKNPLLRGSFIPYVLLTGMERGMAWFAENDRGWTQHEDEPAVAVERHGNTVTLVLKIIADPITLDQPRTIAFGLHPIPLKPLDPDWRRCPNWDGISPDTFAGNNLKGDDHTVFWLYPENSDWEAVQRRLAGENATQRIVGRAARANANFAERHGRPPRPREKYVPGLYWDMQWVGGWPKHTAPWAAQWHPDYTYYLPEFVDFSIWAWREWVRKTDKAVAGIYLDDVWPIPSKLDWSPVTHTLPDGHVQPGWQWHPWRARMMRTRQVFYGEGLPPKFCAHTTHTYFAPYHSFFDYFLDGEDHYSSPPHQSDFIDHWPLARMRFAHNGKWGIVTGWLGWTGNSTPTDKYPAWTFRQQRAFTGMIALHDIEWPFAGSLAGKIDLRERGTVFLPYWGDVQIGKHAHDGLKLAAWKHDGKCLLLLVNVGKDRLEAEVTLDLTALGWKQEEAKNLTLTDVDATLLTYFDADVTTIKAPEIGAGTEETSEFALEESDDDLPLQSRRDKDPDGKLTWQNGLLRCPVRRHDYRLFLIDSADAD